ncbi:hypothetical protein H9P43_007862 [Blastocladiella emersonii ATCC 22665]|nr:hypothetical protein H9P43_007862 [Blastocladiella emersonii ATCC 22665]
MTVTLNIPELIERVLCFAVWSLSRDDLDGFQQIAGVTHANLIPRVHKAILRHSSYHTADKAMRNGHAALLDKYLALGISLNFLSDTLRASPLRTLDWLRNSGLALPKVRTDDFLHRVRGTLGFPKSKYNHLRDRWERIPTDSVIFAAVDAIAAGTQTELKLCFQPITINGINALNVAVTSPDQALTSLNLKGSTIDCERLSHFRFPSTLTSLNLSHSWILETADRRWIDSWQWPSQLERLDFSYNRHDAYFATRLLERLPCGLKALKLMDNRYGDHLVLAILKRLPPCVIDLDFTGNDITATGFADMCPHLPVALESISMCSNKLCNENATSTVRWSFPATVKTLIFSGTDLYTIGARALADAMPPNLETLHVKSANISEPGAKHLLTALPATLRSLDLSSNLDSRSASILYLLARSLPAGLERLELMSAGLTPKIAAYMFRRLPRTLRDLIIRGNDLGAHGFRVLAQCMPPSLEKLDLERTNASDDAVALLAPVLPSTLRSLDLSGTFEITDDGARVLAQHLPPALEKLLLIDTRITNGSGEAALRDAAPATLTELQFPVT